MSSHNCCTRCITDLVPTKLFSSLKQNGPTTYVQWAILQKHGNLQATTNKRMYKTTHSIHKIQNWKREGKCVREEIAIYYKSLSVGCLWWRLLCDACGGGWHNIIPLSIPVSVVATNRILSSVFSSAIQFLFIELTCFIVQYRKCRRLLSRTYVLPNIESIFSV